MNFKDPNLNQSPLSTMEVVEIFNYLPHRYPFLMVDRVLDLKLGHSIKAIKAVTFNEPQFQGHFPQLPIFPGVLLIEAMAQAVGILAFKTSGSRPNDNSIYLLVGVDEARFKRQVHPGDTVVIEAQTVTNKRGIWKFKAQVSCADKSICSAIILCAEQKR